MEKKISESGNMFGKAPFFGIVIMMVVITGLLMDSSRADGDNFYADIIRLDNVTTKIHQNYVEELSSKELIDNAIKGMMNSLDPYTSYFEARDYEELRIHTEGKFGGLGIQISIRDDVLTVMTPISGTPASRAGVQSGDQIIKIDGESTRGISIEDAVNKLRGAPGSPVSILIRRKGAAKDIEYSITREIINIKSVPFYGVLDDSLGYIQLSNFSQEAASEVERAIRVLLDEGIKGLVFDLRNNPGGLLPQAIEVADKFLPQKSLVVSTRGRVRSQNNDFYGHGPSVLPEDFPLAVMVDYSSASASEIVAGAIQDWDRGIIVGDTTFGKGSVQSVLPLDKAHHLKLTTALYYTPSGRGINRSDMRRNDTASGENRDESEDESENSDTKEYNTKNGRVVFGGGGIIPDIVVERDIPKMPVRALFGKDAFFQFVNTKYPLLQERNQRVGPDFVVTDEIMEAFYGYLDSIDFTYNSIAQLQFEEFKKKSGLIPDTTIDSTRAKLLEFPQWSEAELEVIKAATAQMDSVLAQDSRRAVENNELEIRRHLRDAFLAREFGQDHELVFRIRLKEDEQLKKAMEIISDADTYNNLLNP
ncbi:Carboxyl-terminal protease [Chitinispirillum alkaliphilum]|nr:Carboxyl-terminal protease [Chitinispirillum alkaliphilum]